MNFGLDFTNLIITFTGILNKAKTTTTTKKSTNDLTEPMA